MMLNRIRPRLTYANVVSSIALFVVLGGGAYATIDRRIQTRDLARHSVGTGKLKPKAVGTGKLKPRAVGTGKLKQGAVGTRQLRDGVVTTEKVAGGIEALRGPQGEQGREGEHGPQGEQGPPGPSTGPAGGDLAGSYPNPAIASGAVTASKLDGPYRVTGPERTVGSEDSGQASASCEFGDQILAGGIRTTDFGGPNEGFEVRDSYPSFSSFPGNRWSWAVNVANNSSEEMSFRPHALCLRN